MHECFPGSECGGDARLVRSEVSVNDHWSRRQSRHSRKGKLILLLFGCALFSYGCANDDDTSGQHRHRHRHGQEEVIENLDRPDSSNPSPPSDVYDVRPR